MEKSSLVNTLRLFSQAELEALHLFVASPAFNETQRAKDTIRLFKYLKPHFPDFSGPDLTKAAAGALLFPKRKEKEKEVMKAMSHLQRVVHNFIQVGIISGLNRNLHLEKTDKNKNTQPSRFLEEARQQLSLMRFFCNRYIEVTINMQNTRMRHASEKKYYAFKTFKNLYNSLKKNLQGIEDFRHFSEKEFTEFYNLSFQMEQELFHLMTYHDNKLAGQHNLPAAMDSIDTLFLLAKLDLALHISNHQLMVKSSGVDEAENKRLQENINSILNMVRDRMKRGQIANPIILINYLFLELINQPTSQEADHAAVELGGMVLRFTKSIPFAIFEKYITHLSNYWNTRYMITKNLNFLEKGFDFQQIKLNLLSSTANIPTSSVQSLFSNAMKLGKLDWAELFLNGLTPERIYGEEHAAMSLDFLWAHLRCEQKRFVEAKGHLPHYFSYSEIKDIFQYARAAMLDVRIRYELNLLEDTESENMVRATTKRIRESRLMKEDHRLQRLNFFQVAKNLYRLKEKPFHSRPANADQQLAKIREKIETEPVVQIEWLREKCDELLKTENK